MAQFAPGPYETHDENHLPDDSDLQRQQPEICVDYLSHKWKERDVWVTWRNISRQKNDIANGMRLENASWRTWWKQRNGLKTISPQTLNWLKDSDVTWLYGPLHSAAPAVPRPKVHTTVEKLGIIPPLPKGRKPILKRRTLAEVLVLGLAKSSYIRTPPDELKELDLDAKPKGPEEQNRLMLLHTKSDTNLLRPAMGRVQHPTPPVTLFPPMTPRPSAMRSPLSFASKSSDSPGLPDSEIKPERHISFNTFVTQFIAIQPPVVSATDEESSPEDFMGEEGRLIMKTPPSSPKGRKLSRQNSRSSRTSDRSVERLTIAPIAPTLLKETVWDASGQGPALVYVPPPPESFDTSSEEEFDDYNEGTPPLKNIPSTSRDGAISLNGEPSVSNGDASRGKDQKGKRKSSISDALGSQEDPQATSSVTTALSHGADVGSTEGDRGRTLHRSSSASSLSDRSRSRNGVGSVSPDSSRGSSSAQASTQEHLQRSRSPSDSLLVQKSHETPPHLQKQDEQAGFVDKAVGTARGLLGSLLGHA